MKSLKHMHAKKFWDIQLIYLVSTIILCFPSLVFNFEIFMYPGCYPKRSYFWTDMNIVNQYNITKCPNTIFSGMQIVSTNFTSPCKREFVYYHTAIFREIIRFYHVKDAFASSNSLVALEDGIVNFWNSKQKGKRWRYTGSGVYEHLIHIPCYWSKTFGHWICDCLVGIILMPSEIVQKSHVLVQFKNEIGRQYLDIIGIKKWQIVSWFNCWCYAKNLYIITGDEPFLGHSVYGVPKLAKLVNEKMKLYKIKATKYYLMNREKNLDRYIANFRELHNEVARRMPQYKWEIFDISPKSARESIKQWASVKIMLCHAGSGTFNIPFMKNNTGICAIMPNTIEYGVGANAAQLGIWVLGMSHTHPIYSYNISVNIPWVVTGLMRLCFAVENGRWPTEKEIPRGGEPSLWRPMWNITKTREETGIYTCP